MIIPTQAAPWFEFFGRLHIMVLHMPIGLLVGLGILEFIAVLRSKPASREVVGWVVWLAAVSAIIAAGSGYVLGIDGSDSDWRLTTHRQLGIAVAIASVVTALAYSVVRVEVIYRLLLLITIGLLIPTGHLGASMTHGPDFLTTPFTKQPTTAPAMACTPAPAPVLQPLAVTLQPPVPQAPAPPPPPPVAVTATADELFKTHVLPVLAERCAACHGERRQKGGLAVHTLEAIAKGGKDGAVVIPGKPADSLLAQRLRLPLDDDGHMPPSTKTQLTEEEIKAIEQWITAGPAIAAVEPPKAKAAVEPIPPPPVKIAEAPAPSPPPPSGEQVPLPTADALAALKAALVHYEAVTAGSDLLSVDFSAVAPKLSDAAARKLIEPLLPQLESLSLNRAVTVSDETVTLLKNAPQLRELNLGSTKVGDSGIAALAGLKNLKELVLSRTRLNDTAIDAIAAIPSLERVYVWKSGLSREAIAKLRKDRPQLIVDAGDSPLATTQEAEPEIKLTSDAPIPGEEPPVPALKPVNTVCPVTGSPVNPQYAVVFKNRVIGFCCPNCPKEFLSDPAKFEAKLQIADAAAPPAPPAPAVVAPPPAPVAPPVATALKPANTTCPVSGAPVDPQFVAVFENRLIGFCCHNCPKTFWEDPAKFKDKLPPPTEGVVLAPVNKICPVSGAPVKPQFAILFKNQVIGFCCGNCPGSFWAEPAKYETKLQLADAAAPPAVPPAAPTPAVAAVPPAPVAPAVTALKPANATCPVSGAPVDPQFVAVFENRLIGFCCHNCPKTFWEDPAKFKDKLPPPTEGVVLAPVNKVCPVSGAPVKPQFAILFKNQVVGFCCGNCPGSFWAEPAKFEAKLQLADAQPAPVAATPLTPTNATCPVSGTPVDPQFVAVFDNRLIGFCCQHCPKTFWEDPAKFKDKLPPPTPGVALSPVNTVCPVSGAPIKPEFSILYKNRVVSFCCGNCPSQFWADPTKFESKLPAEPLLASERK